jgi:flagellar biosynthesis component FlhA
VSDLRKRLQAQLGVRIPWVYHGIGPDLEPAQVDFKVYGRWVGSTFLHNDSATWLGQLVDGLDRAVRGHLFRLVGVDDIALWLEGWDLQHRDAPEWRPTDPIVDRLRLARLLRMLLREGASVADREAVLAGLDAAGGSDRGRESATLDTVRDVRRRLGPEALGLRPGGAVAMLPPPLEARLASGLADGRPAWELARHDACRLVADLRAWLDEQPREPDVVVVDDDRLRPFVWRLLADRRVLVLSRGELGHE